MTDPSLPESKPWPRAPRMLEVNAWTWLDGIRRRYQAPLTLADVPESEWDALALRGIDAVWLMGVWQRSAAARRIAQERGLFPDGGASLPIAGSPYAILHYSADPFFGGPAGLAAARSALASRGLKLLLDYVPNHVAIDHPWALVRPEFLLQGSGQDAAEAPGYFFETGGRWFAHARDPHFPPWPDTAQINIFHPGFRSAAIAALRGIAAQCDGVRCDMAALLLDDVFLRTWGRLAHREPQPEFWLEVIPAVKEWAPDFLFCAEVYWALEEHLLSLGFDLCYDKDFYDNLAGGTPAQDLLTSLARPQSTQDRLLRFLENHDEPRAAAVFPAARHRAAAVAWATTPGAKLLQHGQREGRRVHVPVEAAREPDEAELADLPAFYDQLLDCLSEPLFREGEWMLCECTGWPDNLTYRNIAAWCWRLGQERAVVVINFSPGSAEARVRIPWDDLRGSDWRLFDEFRFASYDRSGEEMSTRGLFVGLEPWGFHVFRL